MEYTGIFVKVYLNVAQFNQYISQNFTMYAKLENADLVYLLLISSSDLIVMTRLR